MSNNQGMDQVKVVRNWSSQAVPMFFYSLMLLLFVFHLSSGSASARALPAILVAVSVVGIFRATRAGHLEVSGTAVTIRTFYRTKVIPLDQIESVEPVEIAQVTRRVFPVITMKDGSKYNVSEFFSQRNSYYKRTEQSIVTQAIKAIEDARN